MEIQDPSQFCPLWAQNRRRMAACLAEYWLTVHKTSPPALPTLKPFCNSPCCGLFFLSFIHSFIQLFLPSGKVIPGVISEQQHRHPDSSGWGCLLPQINGVIQPQYRWLSGPEHSSNAMIDFETFLRRCYCNKSIWIFHGWQTNARTRWNNIEVTAT